MSHGEFIRQDINITERQKLDPYNVVHKIIHIPAEPLQA